VFIGKQGEVSSPPSHTILVIIVHGIGNLSLAPFLWPPPLDLQNPRGQIPQFPTNTKSTALHPFMGRETLNKLQTKISVKQSKQAWPGLRLWN
jgi:hypothetical protein